MIVARTASELRTARAEVRSEGEKIALVPTMGALHEGHLSLVSAAHDAADRVALSIFVNPLQFGPAEDLSTYPRDEQRDLRLAEEAGVDLVFLPSVTEMYPHGASTTVRVGPLATILEGADRPGHFDGVATVVSKLFNIVEPDVAVFGQKDAQQVAVVRKLVRDLSFDVVINVEPTVRDADGLALSSRNANLSADERRRAPAIHKALLAGAESAVNGDLEKAEQRMKEVLAADGLQPSYACAVDPTTFASPSPGGPVLLLIAARLGSTRLIDNMMVV